MVEVVHTNWIIAPTLCVDCFRRTETAISERVDARIRECQDKLSNFKLAWEEGRVPMSLRREQFLDICEKLEDRIMDLKIQCKAEIAAFRGNQGVFADG